MTPQVSRREFVSAAALGVALVPLLPSLGLGQLRKHAKSGDVVRPRVRPRVRPFDLHLVRLRARRWTRWRSTAAT